MDEVCAIIETSDATSRSVSSSAADVGTTSATLHAEMDHFLRALAEPTPEQRRQYERVPGNGATARLRTETGETSTAPVIDLSRGGIALRCTVTLLAGAPVSIEINGQAALSARVVRAASELLALAFVQNDANMAKIDQVLAPLSRAA
jgi:methyl-accepting chemotaxis protein